jgi:threonyl-tRNA synthetase
MPNGASIFNKLQSFLRAQYPQFGFKEVVTPTIYKKSLWELSGHWENYAKDMFEVKGRGFTGQTANAEVGQDEEFGLKPMNCPGHCLIFASKQRSYRDLPIRYADFSALHRNEISGALSGLTRVRRFHQDDAHIFCRPSQILDEIKRTLEFVGMVYNTFGLGPYKLVLSTRPADKFIGSIVDWDKAESQLKTALEASGREWSLSEGDGAFYGPKIDIILRDATGKEHQTATIQLDFQLPQRFQLTYQAPPEDTEAAPTSGEGTNLDPGYARPVMIHRAILGSVERFMALLIEHYNGVYPFWLSPRKIILLSLNQDPAVLAHIEHLKMGLMGVGKETPNGLPRPVSIEAPKVDVDVDTTARSLGKKIREAKRGGWNFIGVVGPAEVANNTFKLEFGAHPEAARDRAREYLQKSYRKDLDSKKGVEVEASEAASMFRQLMHEYL